jgi:hypothetical protein
LIIEIIISSMQTLLLYRRADYSYYSYMHCLALISIVIIFSLATPLSGYADSGASVNNSGSKYYQYNKNPVNPANKYDPANPLNPASRYSPNNPLNPANKYDSRNPLNPASRYSPSNPLNPMNRYDPNNPISPGGRYNPYTPFKYNE